MTYLLGLQQAAPAPVALQHPSAVNMGVPSRHQESSLIRHDAVPLQRSATILGVSRLRRLHFAKFQIRVGRRICKSAVGGLGRLRSPLRLGTEVVLFSKSSIPPHGSITRQKLDLWVWCVSVSTFSNTIAIALIVKSRRRKSSASDAARNCTKSMLIVMDRKNRLALQLRGQSEGFLQVRCKSL